MPGSMRAARRPFSCSHALPSALAPSASSIEATCSMARADHLTREAPATKATLPASVLSMRKILHPPDKPAWCRPSHSLLCIQSTDAIHPMPAQLLRLETAPDLVERVYGALLDAVIDGSLPPGARLTQEDIARQLAVSRQPVLQALRLLQADGPVAHAPGRGLTLAPLDGACIH